MAKKKPLTGIQQEFKRELKNLRRRAQSAFKAGYLSIEALRKIPEKITDEYVRKHASTRAIESLRNLTAKKIRTPKAADLYRECYQNELEQSQPEQEPLVERKEIVNDYLSTLYEKLEEAYYEPDLPHKISDNAQRRRMSNVNRLSAILDSAVNHYGEDNINMFLSDPEVVTKLNDIIDKIAVTYAISEQRDADALVIQFANVFNGGPLSDDQMQSLEEYGAFDFSEDDLL